jgi:UDP-glucose 4-epimerase
MDGKRVAITGGAGFIGSNLTHELCHKNEVTVIDNLSTGSMENIKELVNKHKIRFLNKSITELVAVKDAFRDVDYVLHQAAIPSVPRSVRDPLRTNETGIVGTLTVLVAARDCDVKKVIFASSSSVYGDAPTLPKREDMLPNPLSPYALTKATGEHYCRLFHDLYGLKTTALRYFNVYGSRQDPKSEYAAVIPKFISCALSGEPMPMHGDGMQTRDFTFVKDVVAANLLAVESSAIGVFNIAGGKRVSVMELAGIIAKECGVELKVEHLPARAGDVRDSLADVSKAKRDFGYEPRYSLEEGLKETVKWFKDRF